MGSGPVLFGLVLMEFEGIFTRRESYSAARQLSILQTDQASGQSSAIGRRLICNLQGFLGNRNTLASTKVSPPRALPVPM